MPIIQHLGTAISGGGGDTSGGDSVTTSGAWKIHSFTSTGTSNLTVTGDDVEVEYLIVGGGGGGGGTSTGSSWAGGGGGAGGVVHGTATLEPGTYAVTVGTGGAGSSTNGDGGSTNTQGADGSKSSFNGQVAFGGGGGGSRVTGGESLVHQGRCGGCGGGVSGINNTQSDLINQSFGAYSNTLRKVGDPTASTTVPFVGAGGSVEFDGDDSLYIRHKKELQIADNDFCIEFWFRTSNTAQGDYKVVASKGSNNNQTQEFAIELMSDRKIDWYYSTSGASWTNVECTNTLSDSTWYHLAFLRKGSNFSVYVDGTRTYNDTSHNYEYWNGVSTRSRKKEGGEYHIANFDCGSNTFTNSTDNSGNTWYSKQSASQYGANCLISNYRHVIGNSVYDPAQTSITVPTSKLTSVPGTVVLACQYSTQSNYDDVTMTDSTKVGGWFRRQGWDGGRMYMWAGSGGGGAGGSGSPAKPNLDHKACDYAILDTTPSDAANIYSVGGAGGHGYVSDITGSSVTYAGGGGGGAADNNSAGNNQAGASGSTTTANGGDGGTGGGARGGHVIFNSGTHDNTRSNYDGQDATANTGGGGGGAAGGNIGRGGSVSVLAHGGDGASGIVIIRQGGTVTAPTATSGSTYHGANGSGNKYLQNTTQGTTDLQMGTGAFTIDGFYKFNTDTSPSSCWKSVFSIGPGHSTSKSITLYNTTGSTWPNKSNGHVDYDVCPHLITNTNYCIAAQREHINDGEWHHFAICRTGGFMRMWIDGGFQFEVTDTTDYDRGDIYIGYAPNCNSTEMGQHRGWINSLRVIKGQALYTGRNGINVPREKVTTSTNGATPSNVKLLCCQHDSDPTACTVAPSSWSLTNTGSVVASTQQHPY